MVAAYLLIGMIAGFAGFVGALLIGATFWMALAAYSLTATCVVLLSSVALVLNSQGRDPVPTHQPAQAKR